MTDEHSELLELLQQAGLDAWIQPGSKGSKLKVVLSYNLGEVTDFKHLYHRLKEIKDLGTLGL